MFVGSEFPIFLSAVPNKIKAFVFPISPGRVGAQLVAEHNLCGVGDKSLIVNVMFSGDVRFVL